MRSLSFSCALGESLRLLIAFLAAAASFASLVSSLVSTVLARAELVEALATFFSGAIAVFLSSDFFDRHFLGG
jgi:hypothetical protein